MYRQPTVYILTNKTGGTLYTGVTGNLAARIWQHRNHAVKGFTERYNLTRLVYIELCDDMLQAIAREKQIKAGSRQAKIRLIEQDNPEWRDLYLDITG